METFKIDYINLRSLLEKCEKREPRKSAAQCGALKSLMRFRRLFLILHIRLRKFSLLLGALLLNVFIPYEICLQRMKVSRAPKNIKKHNK